MNRIIYTALFAAAALLFPAMRAAAENSGRGKPPEPPAVCPSMTEEASVTVDEIEGGVRITVKASRKADAAKIQENAKKHFEHISKIKSGRHEGGMKKPEGRPESMEGGNNPPEPPENADRQGGRPGSGKGNASSGRANGTSGRPGGRGPAMCACMLRGAEASYSNISDGVVITVVSSDKDTAKKIAEAAKNPKSLKSGNGKDDRKSMKGKNKGGAR